MTIPTFVIVTSSYHPADDDDLSVVSSDCSMVDDKQSCCAPDSPTSTTTTTSSFVNGCGKGGPDRWGSSEHKSKSNNSCCSHGCGGSAAHSHAADGPDLPFSPVAGSVHSRLSNHSRRFSSNSAGLAALPRSASKRHLLNYESLAERRRDLAAMANSNHGSEGAATHPITGPLTGANSKLSLPPKVNIRALMRTPQGRCSLCPPPRPQRLASNGEKQQ
ncbi:hypothetical protein SEMRO_297_G110840.1 [Seminavis robusta]|uniref:Uncharacterized protein n=1 Tax=Seminavis robusta TaxID=568900 RepID=A0A9N8HAI0_9STRA|nr:hypothetical protein SEMRO_297_G110840.1 [Seminavis robusta]|eukprot:Sro297_g110840.1 n/a (218) ;mRNA; f:12383-13036